MRLVIFDLDGTLACQNVSFAFSKFLYRKRRLSLSKMLTLIGVYIVHKCGLLSVKSVHAVAFRCTVAKRCAQDIDNEISIFLKETEKSLFRPYLIERLEEAKSKGDSICLLSSSPECIVLPIAKRLGIHTVFATQYARDSAGAYIHIASIVDGQKKREFLENFLEKKPFLKSSIVAYTDSSDDVPLLEAVGTPIAVCPDPMLSKIAKRRSWPILRE